MCAAASRCAVSSKAQEPCRASQQSSPSFQFSPLSSFAQAILGDFRKGRRRFVETSWNFGELLPAPEDDIAPSRIVFDEVGATPGTLGRDHGGARTRERSEHAIAA